MQRYVVQKTPYGKFAVSVLDDEGRTEQTISLHPTRAEASAAARLLNSSTAPLVPVIEGEDQYVPSLLRGSTN